MANHKIISLIRIIVIIILNMENHHEMIFQHHGACG